MSVKIGHVDEIVEKCIDIFRKLPKNGKPIAKEWTVLSCVLQYDKITSSFEVISLGTGSKCIGATKMSSAGDTLNDSHAEVIARRGFLVYLYDNMLKALENKLSIFIFVNNKFKLKSNLEFIFYSSQMPCGDAAIMRKQIDEECFGQIITTSKRQANTDASYSELDGKKLKLDNHDIYRTGAKCLPHSEQDTKSAGANYHLLGKVRTKPGRGDRTLSVSCSDKIARWIHVGVQGALLDMLLSEPIWFSSLIFGGGVPYSEESLMRACLKRSLVNSLVTSNNVPQFYQASVIFPHIKNEINTRSAPGSILWIKSDQMLTEVAVQGRKLGLTKKKGASPDNSLCISKYNLYKKFQQVLMKIDVLEKNVEFDSIRTLSYNEAKRKSKKYLEHWETVKECFFKTWTVKPDIWNFVIK